MLVIVFLLTLLASTFVFAQKETGAIEGTVKDNDGRPIPSVTVIASSVSLIGGSATTDTDQDGNYRFPVLPPGTYEVQAQLSGFQTVIQKDIRVFVGKTLTVVFFLEFVKTSETITVLEKPPLIDITTSAVTHTVPPEIVSNIPKPKSFRDLVALTPGVGDDLVAHGSSEEASNAFWIDGVDVDSPWFQGDDGAIPGQRLGPRSSIYNTTAISTIQYDYNWFQEAQVNSLAAGAEYGGFTGLVANFVTRSGSNTFHGLIENFFQNEHLSSINRPDNKKVPHRLYDFSAQLGGPILRDKLWFFSGIQMPYNEREPFRYDGTVTEAYPKAITKLTYRLNEDNTIQGFANYNHHKTDGADALGSTLPEATSIVKCNEASWNSTWISLLSSATTLEARFGGFWSQCETHPRNGEIPGHVDVVDGDNDIAFAIVNAALSQTTRQLRPQTNITLSHNADNFLKGNHDFKFGVEWERSNAVDKNYFNGGMFYYDYYGAQYSRYVVSGNITDDNTSNHRTSAFVVDNWNFTDGITLNLGLRWDHNRGVTDLGTVFKTDPIAPRFGVAWSLKQKYPTVLKLHYGDYYEALRAVFYKDASTGGDPIRKDYFDGTTWVLGNTNPRSPASINPDAKQPLVREFIVGMDHELPHGTVISVHYIHREWKNILEFFSTGSQYEPVPFVNPITGEAITLYRYISGPTASFISTNNDLYRHYNGIEISGNAYLSKKLSMSGSFNFSRIKGNFPNAGFTFFPGVPVPGGDPNTVTGDPNAEINSKGILVNDPTFAWKLVGTYSLPWGVNTGWYYRHETGDTWTPRVVTPRSFGPRIFFFGLPRGSNRYPSRNLVDLRAEKEFPFYRGQLRFTADIFNVFNSGVVTRVFTNYIADHPGGAPVGQPQIFVDPRTLQLGIRYSF